jgi:Ca2+-binding RTX toxin-like protein
LVLGSAGGNMMYVNTTSGGLLYGAGSGFETVDASLSKGSNTISAGADRAGGDLLVGGAGNDFINANAGSDTLIGGGGANAFGFFSANGGPSAKVIGDFSGLDTVYLQGYGADAAATAIAGATTAGGSTTITLSDNTKITFTGVTSSAALTGHIVSS